MSSKALKARHLSSQRSYSQTAHDWYLATALYDGVEDGDLKHLTALLVTKGASPNVVLPEYGIAPIHLAIGLEDSGFCFEAVNLFLCYGGDPNVRSAEGLTPVHVAAIWGRNSVLDLLLKNGGDPWLQDNEGKNAFKHAHDEEHWETFKLLDDFKDHIVSEKPDVCAGGTRYKLRLDRVKVYSKDLCAEYKAEPMAVKSSFTQTVTGPANTPCEEEVTKEPQLCSGVVHNIEKCKKKGINPFGFAMPITVSQEDRLELLPKPCVRNKDYNFIDEVFDMKFDMLPNDQELKALDMVNSHRQGITVYEYKPDSDDDYYADDDHDKTVSSVDDPKSKDGGYFTGSGSKTSTSLKSDNLYEILKQRLQLSESKSVGSKTLGSKSWMTNITQRKKDREKQKGGNSSCPQESVVDVSGVDYLGKTPKEMHLGSLLKSFRSHPGFNTPTNMASDGAKDNVKQHSSKVLHELRKVSSDISRKLKRTNLNLDSAIEHSDVSLEQPKTKDNDLTLNSSQQKIKYDGEDSKGVELPPKNISVEMQKFIEDALLTEDESSDSHKLEHFKSKVSSDFEMNISSLDSSKLNCSKRSDSDKYFSCSSIEDNNLANVNNENRKIINISVEKNSCNDTVSSLGLGDVKNNSNVNDESLANVNIDVKQMLVGDSVIENPQSEMSVWLNKSNIISSTPEKLKDNSSDNIGIIHNNASVTEEVSGSPCISYSNSDIAENSPVHSDNSCDIFETKEASLASSDKSSPRNKEVVDDLNEALSVSRTDSEIYDEPLKRGFTFHHIPDLTEDEGEVSVTEEYLYTDEDDGIELVEERHLPSHQLLDKTDSVAQSQEDRPTKALTYATTTDTESAVSSVEMAYETDVLRRDLEEFGIAAGPITGGTKRVYLRQLKRARRRPKPPPPTSPRPEYSAELERLLLSEEKKDLVQKWSYLEEEMCAPFQCPDPDKRWREGIAKVSFTYLLLDPRITQNLPVRSLSLPEQETFSNFLEAIFYVGRGKRSRPYSHLYEALAVWNRWKYPTSKKVNKILEIWRSGQGVVCLHVFQNVIPVEAMTREASMIDAIGLKCLTNEKVGDHYAVAAAWSVRRRQQLGAVLLHRALNILMAEGERQLRPPDISR